MADPTDWESVSAAPVRAIDCVTPAVVPLVLDTVQRATESGRPRVEMSAIDTAAAAAVARVS